MEIKKCVFKTDAKQLADACQRLRVQGESYFHMIISDCVDCKYFLHRSMNVVAHTSSLFIDLRMS